MVKPTEKRFLLKYQLSQNKNVWFLNSFLKLSLNKKEPFLASYQLYEYVCEWDHYKNLANYTINEEEQIG